MAVNIKNVHARSIASITAAYEDAASEYRQAALAGDEDAAANAAMKMANLEAMHDKINGMAQRAVAQMPMAQNKYGLSPAEVEMAHKSFGPIKKNGVWTDLSLDEKEALYSQNRQKYRQKIASGEYQNQVR
jgi:hypothetical protein